MDALAGPLVGPALVAGLVVGRRRARHCRQRLVRGPRRRSRAAALLLPGWAWLEAWLPDFREGVWRIILAAGLSLILTSLGTLYLSYLPGPLTEGHLLALCALLTLPPWAVALRRRPAPLIWPDRRLALLLGVVLVLAAALRLPRLGYAEFHEDEVEVTSLATRTIGGEDYAVFLHRKGPEQMLPPLAGWLLAGRITEGWARLPFALAGLLGVAALTLFAHRLGGGRPAWRPACCWR